MVEMLLTARSIDFSIKNEVRLYRCLCSFLILFVLFLCFVFFLNPRVPPTLFCWISSTCHCITLCSIVLYALCSIVLNCIVFDCITFYCTVPYRIVSYRIVVVLFSSLSLLLSSEFYTIFLSPFFPLLYLLYVINSVSFFSRFLFLTS
jgi:hypothetical protein